MVAKMQRVSESSDLGRIVLEQISQKPEMRDQGVSAVANQGIVTLTGSVNTKAARIAVETVAKQVRGVRAVANDLVVKALRERGSTEIATDVLKALRDHILLTGEDIRVIVRDGCVILEGNVHHELQKMLAEAQVKRLRGIFGFSNQLEVRAEARPEVAIETAGSEDAGLLNGSAWAETGEAEAG